MSIEKRLKDDAARIAGIQPPADLSRRLRASLGAMPSITRRWFKPALAVLTVAMLVVILLPGNVKMSSVFPTVTDMSITDSPEIVPEYSSGVQHEPRSEEKPVPPASPPAAPPWGRAGAFSGLALLAGILWASEYWRRHMALAVVVPLVVLILGNAWLLRSILF
jgi:hypothetical protein